MIRLITCSLCDQPVRWNCLFLTAYAEMVLHWMDQHPAEYGQMHPEVVPYLELSG